MPVQVEEPVRPVVGRCHVLVALLAAAPQRVNAGVAGEHWVVEQAAHLGQPCSGEGLVEVPGEAPQQR